MQYVIYGAGAVGGTIGARLFMAGLPVTLIARGSHLERIRSEGLVFSEPERTATLAIPCVGEPQDADLAAGDVVILGMKSQDTPGAIATLAATAPPGIGIVCAQNGVNNERVALRHFADVTAAFVVVAADHLEPGVVHRFGDPFVGVLDVGRYPKGVDTRVESIAGDFTVAGFRSEARPDVMRAKYRKLYFNLGNVVEALLGKDDSTDLTNRTREEAERVLAAAGITMVSRDEDAARRKGLRTVDSHSGSRGGGSSWQSLVRRTGSIETDYLNGEIVLLGRLHSIPTPVNAALCEAARAAARRKAAPGSLDRSSLEALIDRHLEP